MKIYSNNLTGLKVETESGRKLGKVESFNIETDSQSILEYKIKPFGLVKGLVARELIIPRGQVIDISENKMIVEDLIVEEKNKAVIKNKVKEKVVQGAAMKERIRG